MAEHLVNATKARSIYIDYLETVDFNLPYEICEMFPNLGSSVEILWHQETQPKPEMQEGLRSLEAAMKALSSVPKRFEIPIWSQFGKAARAQAKFPVGNTCSDPVAAMLDALETIIIYERNRIEKTQHYERRRKNGQHSVAMLLADYWVLSFGKPVEAKIYGGNPNHDWSRSVHLALKALKGSHGWEEACRWVVKQHQSNRSKRHKKLLEIRSKYQKLKHNCR